MLRSFSSRMVPDALATHWPDHSWSERACFSFGAQKMVSEGFLWASKALLFSFLLLSKTIGFIVLFWYLMQFAQFIGQCRILAGPTEQDFRFL